MGSVMSDVKCINPKCKFKYAMRDFYYKSGEEYNSCLKCGSTWGVEITNRPNEIEKVFPKDCKWTAKFKEYKNIRMCAYEYGKEQGAKACGGIAIKDLQDFKKQILKEKEITHATYTRKIKGKWLKFDIINGTKTDFEVAEVLTNI